MMKGGFKMGFTKDFYKIIDSKINSNYDLCKERLDYFIENNDIVAYEYYCSINKWLGHFLHQRLTINHVQSLQRIENKIRSFKTPLLDHCSIYKGKNKKYYLVSHVHYSDFSEEQINDIHSLANEIGINIQVFEGASWFRENLSLVVMYPHDTKEPKEPIVLKG
jgi:hypothetical protein